MEFYVNFIEGASLYEKSIFSRYVYKFQNMNFSYNEGNVKLNTQTTF